MRKPVPSGTTGDEPDGSKGTTQATWAFTPSGAESLNINKI